MAKDLVVRRLDRVGERRSMPAKKMTNVKTRFRVQQAEESVLPTKSIWWAGPTRV
jgi:hypothetical protein